MWRAGRWQISYENETWWVGWKRQPDGATWTFFESATGRKRLLRAPYSFQHVNETQLVDALTKAAEMG